MLTPPIIQALKEYCISENQIYLGMTILKEMIVKRPCVKFQVLDVLLDLTVHEKTELRQNAIRTAKNLYEKADLKDRIEERALMRLKALLMPTPPPDLIKLDATTNNATNQWTEESIRLSLYLYLTLLPSEHQLIHQLASIYTASSSEIKRTILRVLEGPVKGMGMDSPELLLLVENCPKGAETLVTRVIHILTDKAMPSVELVDRVRDLYNKRVSDVRFLIPVLNGLSKSEVVTALPRLIKLNPVVVKEVFNRLLGVNGQENMGNSLNPIELLVTLHTLDSNKVDMKTIIKACNLCFAERSVYTQDTLALVIQQLLDLNPLPTLIMRTVIQALATYPRLTGFVINIMQRLLTKQVWKNKKVWEGFVRCCQRTKPQSFQILLQLQPAQLKDSFTICPDLREALLSHIMSFNPHQRAHIPKSVMSLIEKPLEKPTVVTLSTQPNVNSDVEAKKFVSEDSVGGASGLEIKDEQAVNLNADDHQKVAEDSSSSSDVTKQTSPLISITLQKMAEGPKLVPEENLESCGDGKEDTPEIVSPTKL
ncbi:hypothetical protein HELRODRAFT_97791 [Helobdella robusta]|uniref:Symplekin C-terminal domain-containing protein n=1 Tax=Helobdella robusta TaxID=6412 RepID=T1G9J0_HELRO|nr:hypothetical protein HELRODRAFT_97791 [Helobdella robusta]ESO08850.1 hypothetical protein HELRODRAFT_97791 [Helobdella robusta]